MYVRGIRKWAAYEKIMSCPDDLSSYDGHCLSQARINAGLSVARVLISDTADNQYLHGPPLILGFSG
jgi:hypothetical protein